MIYDGKKIVLLREERGLSMADLARRAKIKQPSLWAIEHEHTKKPKAETLLNIAVALNVPLQTILTRKPNPDLNHEAALLSAVFQGLSPANKAALLATAEALANSQTRGE